MFILDKLYGTLKNLDDIRSSLVKEMDFNLTPVEEIMPDNENDSDDDDDDDDTKFEVNYERNEFSEEVSSNFAF